MSISYSLALRLRCICSSDQTFQRRKTELTKYIINRGCKHKFNSSKFNKSSLILRQIAVQQTNKTVHNRISCVVTYSSVLIQITSIIRRCYPVLQSSTRSSEASRKEPLIYYRGPKNLLDYLVRAKISTISKNTKLTQT